MSWLVGLAPQRSRQKIKEGKGTAELTTVEGGKLWVVMLHDGKHIMLKDEKGGTALVTIANVFQSNGVIHVIDSVVMTTLPA